ncbi:MAG: ComEA family DNA-binding protein [Phycisphaerae bacterium]
MTSAHRKHFLGVLAILAGVHLATLVDAWTRGLFRDEPRGRTPTPRLTIDPNTASAAELMLLPRIGPKLAANIVTFREAAAHRPAFRCVEDLDAVERIGPATVALLRPHLRFDSRAPVESADPSPR